MSPIKKPGKRAAVSAAIWDEILRCSPFTVAGHEGPCSVTEVDGALELRDRHGALIKRTTRADLADLEGEIAAVIERMRPKLARMERAWWAERGWRTGAP